jgi:MFS family permease
MEEKGRQGEQPEYGRTGEFEADLAAPTTELMEKSLFRGGVLSAFGYRDFRLLWSGAFISNVGTLIHNTVLLWYVKELTGSNAWVGAVNLANFLPILFFVLYAGSLADRLDRRKLILWTQAVMMAAALFLGIATSLGWSSMAVIMIDTVVLGIAFVFTFPAWRALVPDLVPPHELLNAVALDAAGYNMARFIGPALGALILNVWNAAGAFYINALSFMTVIGALLFINFRPEKSAQGSQSDWTRTKEGVTYVLRNRWAANLLIVLGIAAFFGLSFVVLLPGIAKDVLGQGSWAYGFLLGGIGLGAVIGAPLVTLLNRRIQENRIIRYAMLVTSLMIIIVAVSRIYWLSVLASVGVGTSFLMVAASINTVLQSRVERDMRGRIMSFYILLFQGTAPVGGLLMGYISDVTSIAVSLLVGGCVCLALAVVIIAFPSILKDAVSPGWKPAQQEP